MSKMIQVRDVPDELHSELVRRAKARNQTLTAFVQLILEREVSRPPVEEVLERIRRSEPIDLGMSAAEVIRQARTERDEEIAGWSQP